MISAALTERPLADMKFHRVPKSSIVPGHWVSIGVTGGGHYVRWNLDGAGPNTQVSLAARY